MGSQIKRFRVTASSEGSKFNFEAAEKEILRQFDKWREKEKPTIFSVNFGREHGIYMEEDPHYCYIDVLYC